MHIIFFHSRSMFDMTTWLFNTLFHVCAFNPCQLHIFKLHSFFKQVCCVWSQSTLSGHVFLLFLQSVNFLLKFIFASSFFCPPLEGFAQASDLHSLSSSCTILSSQFQRQPINSSTSPGNPDHTLAPQNISIIVTEIAQIYLAQISQCNSLKFIMSLAF